MPRYMHAIPMYSRSKEGRSEEGRREGMEEEGIRWRDDAFMLGTLKIRRNAVLNNARHHLSVYLIEVGCCKDCLALVQVEELQ